MACIIKLAADFANNPTESWLGAYNYCVLYAGNFEIGSPNDTSLLVPPYELTDGVLARYRWVPYWEPTPLGDIWCIAASQQWLVCFCASR